MNKTHVKTLIQLLKIGVPVAIIVWLLANVDQKKWDQIQHQPKNWLLLGVAFFVAFSAVMISFVRWFLLVRIVELPVSLSQVLRLSFLGYLWNFVGAGSVGGDLFKAILLAKGQQGRRTEAVASVLVDRVVGFYALLLVASLALLLSDLTAGSRQFAILANLVYLFTAVGGGCIILFTLPWFASGEFADRLTRIPKLGRMLAQIMSALRVYRRRWPALLLTLGMSVVVHGMIAFSIWLAAIAVFDRVPTLGAHLVVVPISCVVGALPVSPAGFGTFEFALNELYQIITGPGGAPGVTVALLYRLMTVGVTVVGAVFYWTYRKEVNQVAAELPPRPDTKNCKTNDPSADEAVSPELAIRTD